MRLIFYFAAACGFLACSSPKQTTYATTATNQALAEPADSIIYYKTTYDVEQKDHLPQLLGNWTLHTMQRQTKLQEESLAINLQLKDDKTFTATTACGRIKGNYSVKGVSIKFQDVSFEKDACDNNEQGSEIIRLLTETVSMYTVTGNMLSLQDNSSNKIFRASR